MKKSLLFAFLGIAVGITAMWSFTVLRPQHSARPEVDLRSLAAITRYTLPEDFSPKSMYGEQGTYELVKEADSIFISLADKEGEVQVGPYRFTKSETALGKEDLRLAREVLLSPNSYRGVSACSFNPGVLLRVKRKEEEVFILVCLSCSDMAVSKTKKEEVYPLIGLSRIGSDSILYVLLGMFPNEEGLRKQALSKGYIAKKE